MHESIGRTSSSSAMDRTCGITLGGASVLAVAAMSHHPSIQSHGTRSVLEEAVHEATLSRWIHAAMIVFLLVMTFGLTGFAQRLGLRRPLVLLGLVAFITATAAGIGAGILNGFAFPGMAESYRDAPGEQQEQVRLVLAYGSVVSGVFARMTMLGWCVAVLAWSFAIVGRRGPVLGVALGGVALALTGLGIQSFGSLRLDVEGFGAVVLGLALWCLAIGTLLARGKLSPGEPLGEKP